MTDADPEPVDTTDAEDAEVLLADPDDYHQAQRLREIHRRRQQVSKVLDDIDRWATSDEHQTQKLALADAITAYIAELEPLIERTKESPELPDAMPWDTVGEYADTMGHAKDDDPHYGYHLKVYRACNRYLSEVKPLIEEDDTDEWEV